jgi:plastocyanin
LRGYPPGRSPTDQEARLHARRSLVALALVTLPLTACGGGSDGGDGEGCTDLSTRGDTFEVTIENFEYSPECLTASASQSIRVRNVDDAIHSFTLEGTEVDVDIEGGETFEGEAVSGVVEPGTYPLICTYHPEMTGEVTVVE